MPNVRIASDDFTVVMSVSPEQYTSRAARKLEMTDNPPSLQRKPLTPAAQRALAEAEARRKAAEANAKPMPREVQGPKGPEPTRYGDWENKGIASDF
jgi:hypothetical protein